MAKGNGHAPSVTIHTPTGIFLLKDPCKRGAFYEGFRLGPPQKPLDPSQPSPLTLEDFGTVTNEIVYLFNRAEGGKATHGLDLAKEIVVIGDLFGTATDGKPIYSFSRPVNEGKKAK